MIERRSLTLGATTLWWLEMVAQVEEHGNVANCRTWFFFRKESSSAQMTGHRGEEYGVVLVDENTGRSISNVTTLRVYKKTERHTATESGRAKYVTLSQCLVNDQEGTFSTSDDQSEVEKCMCGSLRLDKTGRIIIAETTH